MIGDTVAQIIERITGKKPCNGCKKRKAMLNRIEKAVKVTFTIRKR